MNEQNIIEVKVACSPEYLPKYAHDGDLGLDVYAVSVEYEKETDSYMYHTGLYMESDAGVGCFLFPRSSNKRTDAYLANSIGLVETYIYRGEICFCFKNRTSLNQLIFHRSLLRYISLPWYKKIFKSLNVFYNIQNNEYNDINNYAYLEAPYKIGERIGQLVFLSNIPTVKFKIVKKEDLSKTERGDGGFGHSGK